MTTISNNEGVARILSRRWVKEGVIMHMAFTLRENETYISVNCPSVPEYKDDVCSFVHSHPDFYADDNHTFFQRALINVGNIRTIKVMAGDKPLNVNVEVEPRDIFKKSHAGIFTRQNETTVKSGTFSTCTVEKP